MEISDGIAQPYRTWAHVAVAIGVMMAVLDSAIANVALPKMAAEFGAHPSEAIWIVSAYQLAVTVSLLPLASLGDILGYKRVFCAGLALFTLASFACSVSASLPGLAMARAAQGLGAAGIMSVNNAMIRFIYPHRLLGRGVSYSALVVAFSSVAGPTMAAALLSWGSWPWLFWVNVPVGILALAVGLKASGSPILLQVSRLAHRPLGESVMSSPSHADALADGSSDIRWSVSISELLLNADRGRFRTKDPPLLLSCGWSGTT